MYENNSLYNVAEYFRGDNASYNQFFGRYKCVSFSTEISRAKNSDLLLGYYNIILVIRAC